MNSFIYKGILVAVATFISGSALAQEKHSFSFSSEGAKSRYTQQMVIDVDDVPGHQVRVFEVQRVFAVDRRPVIDGEAIVEQWARGTSGYTTGVGPNSGFITWLTDKGEKVFLEFSAVAETQPTASGSKRGTAHGALRIVGGTGRFSKVRGIAFDLTEFDTDPTNGYNRGTTKGEYWFEQ